MARQYHYTDDTWWSSNGCSCCEAEVMPAFNSNFTCTLYGEEELLPEALSHFLLNRATGEELEKVANLLNIEVYLDGELVNE